MSIDELLANPLMHAPLGLVKGGFTPRINVEGFFPYGHSLDRVRIIQGDPDVDDPRQPIRQYLRELAEKRRDVEPPHSEDGAGFHSMTVPRAVTDELTVTTFKLPYGEFQQVLRPRELEAFTAARRRTGDVIGGGVLTSDIGVCAMVLANDVRGAPHLALVQRKNTGAGTRVPDRQLLQWGAAGGAYWGEQLDASTRRLVSQEVLGGTPIGDGVRPVLTSVVHDRHFGKTVFGVAVDLRPTRLSVEQILEDRQREGTAARPDGDLRWLPAEWRRLGPDLEEMTGAKWAADSTVTGALTLLSVGVSEVVDPGLRHRTPLLAKLNASFTRELDLDARSCQRKSPLNLTLEAHGVER